MSEPIRSFDESVSHCRADYEARGGNGAHFDRRLVAALLRLEEHPEMHQVNNNGVRSVPLYPTKYVLTWDVVGNIAIPLQLRSGRQLALGLPGHAHIPARADAD